MGSEWLLIESSNLPPQNQVNVRQNVVLALAWAKATLLGKGSKWLVHLFSKMFSHWASKPIMLFDSDQCLQPVCGFAVFFVCTVARHDCPRLSHELFRTRACLHMYTIKDSRWWQLGRKPPTYKKKKQVAPLVYVHCSSSVSPHQCSEHPCTMESSSLLTGAA